MASSILIMHFGATVSVQTWSFSRDVGVPGGKGAAKDTKSSSARPSLP